MDFLLSISGFAHLLFLSGLLALVRKPTRALSWWLLASSCSITLCFSSGMVAAALMSPLEYTHARLRVLAERPSVRHIVVLTAWADDDPNTPLSARLNSPSLYRVLYGSELQRAHSDAEIIVSGSAVAARVMGEVLVELGVPTERVSIEGSSNSTAESAAALRTLIGNEPFLLVTSAVHMPRAMGVMEGLGLSPIPAPTDYQLPKEWWHAEAKPTSLSLAVSDLAAHEYLGLLWYRMRGLM